MAALRNLHMQFPGVGVPAPVTIRRSEEIYRTEGGWFQAHWHFSFDDYYDPAWTRVGALRVFNHDTLQPGAVWPLHAHRDIEGITYVVSGHFEHVDSLGNGGVLEAGGVQRMTLGRGAYHSERNHSRTEPMQFIQMWIVPSSMGLLPELEQRQFCEADRTGRLLQIVKPEGHSGNAVAVHQDASIYAGRLLPRDAAEHIFCKGRGGYLYLIDGELMLNDERLATGDAARIDSPGTIWLSALATSELIIVDTLLYIESWLDR
jgi:quercetin 2,3-dioxygenase